MHKDGGGGWWPPLFSDMHVVDPSNWYRYKGACLQNYKILEVDRNNIYKHFAFLNFWFWEKKVSGIFLGIEGMKKNSKILKKIPYWRVLWKIYNFAPDASNLSIYLSIYVNGYDSIFFYFSASAAAAAQSAADAACTGLTIYSDYIEVQNM